MASAITNDWTGILIGRIESRSKKRLEKLGEMGVQMARSLVPVRTGRLKASIHAEVLKTRVKIIADARRDADNISYAWWVETGTGRGPAQPFLRPTLQYLTGKIPEQFSKWKW